MSTECTSCTRRSPSFLGECLQCHIGECLQCHTTTLAVASIRPNQGCTRSSNPFAEKSRGRDVSDRDFVKVFQSLVDRVARFVVAEQEEAIPGTGHCHEEFRRLESPSFLMLLGRLPRSFGPREGVNPQAEKEDDFKLEALGPFERARLQYRRAVQIEGIELEFLVSPKHSINFAGFDGAQDV